MIQILPGQCALVVRIRDRAAGLLIPDRRFRALLQ